MKNSPASKTKQTHSSAADLIDDLDIPAPAADTAEKDAASRRKAHVEDALPASSRQKKAEKPAEKPEEKVAMTVMVPRSLNEQFRALSKINDMSMNSMIVEDMRRRVKDDEDMVNEVVALDARLAAMRKKSGRTR